MQSTQNINQNRAKVLHSYMQENNIRKDTDVLDAMLTDYAKTLEMPKEEKPIEEEVKPENDIDRTDLDKWVKDLNLKKLG